MFSKIRNDQPRARHAGDLGPMAVMESLEPRVLLSAVVDSVALPQVTFNNGGTTSYDAAANAIEVQATPLQFTSTTENGVFFSGAVNFAAEVDDAGQLVGGVDGDDLVLTGDLDRDLDFVVDQSGTLLTGEIVAFGSEELGATDQFTFIFQVTGGLLAPDYTGQDVGIILTVENSTFTGDFTADFGGFAKGVIGGVAPFVEPQGDPGIDIEKLTNGVDADTADEAVEVAPGEDITWTYLVTNTGEVDFEQAQVTVIDDNGTPDDDSDDFAPALDTSSDNGADGVLSVGETWTYTYTTTASDLTGGGASVTIDFDGLSAGTLVDNQFDGVSIEADGDSTSGNAAMIFDSEDPTGGDWDLATPGYGYNNNEELGNILIISEDQDTNDPDDDARGGVITFTFDEAVTVESIGLLDVDSNEWGGSVVTLVTEGGTQSFDIDALGDNSYQRIDINTDNVLELRVNMISSGAVTDLVYSTPVEGVYGNKATVSVPGAEDTDDSHYTNPDEPAPTGEEGLTPGYWRQSQHFCAWTDYDQKDSFEQVFGVDAAGNPTLLEATKAKGGGEFALQRHATAALLNAANTGIDYAYTQAQIIAMVQQAYATGNFEATKNAFEVENERGGEPDNAKCDDQCDRDGKGDRGKKGDRHDKWGRDNKWDRHDKRDRHNKHDDKHNFWSKHRDNDKHDKWSSHDDNKYSHKDNDRSKRDSHDKYDKHGKSSWSGRSGSSWSFGAHHVWRGLGFGR